MMFITAGFLLIIILAFLFAALVFFSSANSSKMSFTIASVTCFALTLILINHDKKNAPYIIPASPPENPNLLETIGQIIEQFHTRNDWITIYIIIYVIILCASLWFGIQSSNKLKM